MEKEFVTYEQALALKELGFDEPCLSIFIERKFTLIFTEKQISDRVFSAPLKQQAFRWFREEYKLHVSFAQWCGEKFYFNVTDMVHPRRYDEYPGEKLRNFCEEVSQEEIETKALDKLIEIVKKSNIDT